MLDSCPSAYSMQHAVQVLKWSCSAAYQETQEPRAAHVSGGERLASGHLASGVFHVLAKPCVPTRQDTRNHVACFVC